MEHQYMYSNTTEWICTLKGIGCSYSITSRSCDRHSTGQKLPTIYANYLPTQNTVYTVCCASDLGLAVSIALVTLT